MKEPYNSLAVPQQLKPCPNLYAAWMSKLQFRHSFFNSPWYV